MKQRNQFDHLSDEDRQLILNLCSKHTYEQVVAILWQPRADGGLGIVTSASSLCRFYTSSHPEPSRAVLAQYATATHVRHQQESNAFLGAIRASVESRVLESLKNGKALQDLEKEIRVLKTVQHLYLEDSQWRAKNPKSSSAAYREHVTRCAGAPACDFIRDDIANDPGAEGFEPSDFSEVSEFEMDVAVAKIESRRRREEHDRAIEARRSSAENASLPGEGSESGNAPERSRSLSPAISAPGDANHSQSRSQIGPSTAPAQNSILTPMTQDIDGGKPPAISHFPLNFTSQNHSVFPAPGGHRRAEAHLSGGSA